MIKYGFLGRGSEEGFEQAHNEFDADMKIVARISCAFKRVGAFLRRQNSSADPSLIPMLQNEGGKKRGRYQATDKRKRRRLEAVANSATTDLGGGFLEVKNSKRDSTCLIKSEWEDVYLMCAYGIVPDKWKEGLGQFIDEVD